jgi:hypothetical protein
MSSYQAGDESDEDVISEVKINVPDTSSMQYRISIPKWSRGLKWDDEIKYPAKAQKLQKGAHGHISDLAGEGAHTKKRVPPIHPDWPTGLFRKNMNVTSFLEVMAGSETIKEIMKWETDFESQMKRKVEESSQSPHWTKNLLWTSWSAMLQLEITYPKDMVDCQSWSTCLEHIWETYLESAPVSNVWSRPLGFLNTIIHHVWSDSGKVESSAVNTLIRNKIMAPLKKSVVWELHIQDVAERELAWKKLVVDGPLQVPRDVQGRRRAQGESVVSKALTQPQTIHESTITEGVKRLVIEIWGDDMDTQEPVVLESDQVGLYDKAKAVCCLLELLCGSRMVGLMLINWFERVETATMEEWERESLPTGFGSYARCIKVTRLSKEGTRAARQLKEKERMDDVGEVQDRVIVKPLNTMFLDRVFLAPERGFKRTVSKEKDFVTIFLDLIRVLREYVFADHRVLTKGIENPHEFNGMLGVSDEEAESLPKRTRAWLNGVEQSIGKYARKVFPWMFKKNQGTHLLRKIYMIWSYNAFAKKGMKETGYASAVLGHRGFKVSLNYTSLLIDRSVAGDDEDTQSLKKRMKDLETRVDTLIDRIGEAEQLSHQQERNMVKIAGIHGPTWLEKFPRAPRNASATFYRERHERATAMLVSVGAPATISNLAKLGIVKRRPGVEEEEEEEDPPDSPPPSPPPPPPPPSAPKRKRIPSAPFMRKHRKIMTDNS